MSFQGDVGGIGLADLLQSLARGRDGVLTLSARGALRSTLGIAEGQLHLLPDPDEDPEAWRNRARQAWVHEPDFSVEGLRMAEIARAQRIETFFSMLDSDNVHFRFLPGPVPTAPEVATVSPGDPGVTPAGPRRDSIYVQPAGIEAMLLEYARLKDEGGGVGDWQALSEHIVLCPLEVPPDPSLERFFQQCDGDSNLRELSDRLGWPLRQTRITAMQLHARGALRAAEAVELLRLARVELLQTNCERAATRLVAWIDAAPPGLLEPDDAGVLAEEWEAQRLQSALSRMPLDSARRLVQRLSRTIAQPLRTVEHWAELSRIAQHDTLVDLHLLVAQIRAAVEADVPSFKSLLEVARGFSDSGHPLRAAAFLRVAATRQPETTEDRLALGTALLSAGQPAEASPWVVAACRTLLDEGKPERAVEPLRQLIELVPADREVRRMLTRARAFSVRRALVRKNSLVTMAVVLALSIGAVVQYHSERERKLHVEEIEAHLDDPHAALELLEQYFPGEEATRVASLRQTIVERKRDHDNALRATWTERYREAQLECTIGDPVLGLERALAVPPPPREVESPDPWPLASDLFNGLAARVEKSVKDVGDAVEDTPAQVQAEERVLSLIRELAGKLAGKELSAPAKEFGKHLAAFEKRVQARGEQRATARAERQRKENLARQDMLLAAARAHTHAGDHARALQAYQSLLESDGTGRLKELLEKEMAASRKKLESLQAARALCEKGQHAEARTLLQRSLENPGEYLLPWRVESAPSGAHVRLADGSVRSTPFTLETTLFEKVTLRFEAEGCEPRTVEVGEPGNLLVHLSRLPDRAWQASGRVDALPVAVGEDHVVADRDGAIARLTAGVSAWQKKLGTLGGVARAPVFLPRRPGFLLVLSEDGDAWVLDAKSGETEGPWTRNVAPLAGPYVVGDSVLVRFRDGAVWRWREGATPESVDAAAAEAALAPFVARGLENEAQFGVVQNFAVLRHGSADKNRLESPWNDLVVEIVDRRCEVRSKSSPAALFSTDVQGEWVYLAIESPSARAPRGRLWMSDGAGLRSFLP